MKRRTLMLAAIGSAALPHAAGAATTAAATDTITIEQLRRCVAAIRRDAAAARSHPYPVYGRSFCIHSVDIANPTEDEIQCAALWAYADGRRYFEHNEIEVIYFAGWGRPGDPLAQRPMVAWRKMP